MYNAAVKGQCASDTRLNAGVGGALSALYREIHVSRAFNSNSRYRVSVKLERLCHVRFAAVGKGAVVFAEVTPEASVLVYVNSFHKIIPFSLFGDILVPQNGKIQPSHIFAVHIKVITESALICKSAFFYNALGRLIYGFRAYLHLVQVYPVKAVGNDCFRRFCGVPFALKSCAYAVLYLNSIPDSSYSFRGSIFLTASLNLPYSPLAFSTTAQR